MTKLFEYKITGTIDHPKTEPVYLLPRLFGLPFHPWRTLKGMLPEETPGNRPHTNAAPVPRR